jgi:hypothetical protein
VRTARVIKDALGGSGLTGIDMSRDADIPHPFERDHPGHKKALGFQRSALSPQLQSGEAAGLADS